jgi:hypothetical protein
MAVGTPANRAAFRPAFSPSRGIPYRGAANDNRFRSISGGPKPFTPGKYKDNPRKYQPGKKAPPSKLPGGSKKYTPRPGALGRLAGSTSAGMLAGRAAMTPWQAAQRAFWPFIVADHLIGLAVDWWWPPSLNFPLNGVNLAYAMDSQTSQPFVDERYRTNLTPRQVALPVSDPTMMYNDYLRPAPTGLPRAYWGKSYIIPPIGIPSAPWPLSEPVPSPQRQPQPRPWPDLMPVLAPAPDVGRWARPANPSSRPAPSSPPVGPPGWSITFRPGRPPAFRPSPARGRPARGKERKRRGPAAAFVGAFFAMFSAGTEMMDFVEALLAGFGIEGRGWKWNLEALFDALDAGLDFDFGAFFEAWAWNEFEDQLVGRLNGQLRNSLKNLGIRVYGAATPGQGLI